MYSRVAPAGCGADVTQGARLAPCSFAITELASRQYGLFSRQQALQSGLPDRIIHRRLHAERWRQVAPGVYSLPGVPDSWCRSLWLAHLDIGPASVVTHEAAAALHRLILFPPGPVTLTVDHGDHQRSSRRWGVHQSRDLSPAHVTSVDGLPVTTIPRAFVDLAAVAHKERLTRSLEDAHVTPRVVWRRCRRCTTSCEGRASPA